MRLEDHVCAHAVANRTKMQDSFDGATISTCNANNLLSSRRLSTAGATPVRIDLTQTPPRCTTS
jgi:hypothetical protein